MRGYPWWRPLAALSLVVLTLSWAEAGWAWNGMVVKVLDGDSLVVRRGASRVEVRLYGIDAPEHDQPHAAFARQRLRELADRKTVQVDPVDIDRYGRTVARVSVEAGQLSRILVQEGAAWVYPWFCTAQPLCDELVALESTARATRIGLWSEDSPMSPWDWKRKQRRKKSGGGSGTR